MHKHGRVAITCRGRGPPRGRSGGWTPGARARRRSRSACRGSRRGRPSKGTCRRCWLRISMHPIAMRRGRRRGGKGWSAPPLRQMQLGGSSPVGAAEPSACVRRRRPPRSGEEGSPWEECEGGLGSGAGTLVQTTLDDLNGR